MSNGYVNISPEELLKVTQSCLYMIANYDGSEDITHTNTYFSFLKLRKVEVVSREEPRYMSRNCGIVTRLKVLKGVAESVLLDEGLVDRDIRLSILTRSNLMMLLNKNKSFEPYVFGLGY